MADDRASSSGGALYGLSCNLQWIDVNVVRASAVYTGGGLTLVSGTAVLTRVTMSGCSAGDSGGGTECAVCFFRGPFASCY